VVPRKGLQLETAEQSHIFYFVQYLIYEISVQRYPPLICYTHRMSKKNIDDLHDIVDRAADWPEQAREELEESMLSIESRYYGVYILTKDDRAALKKSAEDIRHDLFASDNDLKKVFHNFNRA